MYPEKTKQCGGSKREPFHLFLRSGDEIRRVRSRNVWRKTGLILTAISGALLSSSLALPSFVQVLATVMGIAGSILSILTQSPPVFNHSEGVPATGQERRNFSPNV
ncbi:MAG TPA: hypothetical protein VGN63_05830 [Flavisolibacter sp.]|jgi:hypothetical protein|nr:hypothetical protein [Flavisolibacter sp.]